MSREEDPFGIMEKVHDILERFEGVAAQNQKEFLESMIDTIELFVYRSYVHEKRYTEEVVKTVISVITDFRSYLEKEIELEELKKPESDNIDI